MTNKILDNLFPRVWNNETLAELKTIAEDGETVPTGFAKEILDREVDIIGLNIL